MAFNLPRQIEAKSLCILFLILVFGLDLLVLDSSLASEHPSTSFNTLAGNFRISASDVKHGELQLQMMLRDRPKMSGTVGVGDPIWKWTVMQFAGAGIGNRIYWENKQTESGLFAENHSGLGGDHFSIRVKSIDSYDYQATGEDQWAAAIYELLNIRNDNAFNQISDHLPKQEWVRQFARLEYSALVSLRHFYNIVWIPCMSKRGIVSSSRYWRTDLPATYDEWVKSGGAKGCIDYWSKCNPRRSTGKKLLPQKKKGQRRRLSKGLVPPCVTCHLPGSYASIDSDHRLHNFII